MRVEHAPWKGAEKGDTTDQESGDDKQYLHLTETFRVANNSRAHENKIMALLIPPNISIPDWELVETFIRASGPGGQNVNKVATAVQLRFNALTSPSLPDPVKERLKSFAGRRMTRDGEILIEAKRFRSQDRNREDARARLIDLIERAAAPPRPRIKTKVSPNQKRKRLEDKKKRSAIKTERRSKGDD